LHEGQQPRADHGPSAAGVRGGPGAHQIHRAGDGRLRESIGVLHQSQARGRRASSESGESGTTSEGTEGRRAEREAGLALASLPGGAAEPGGLRGVDGAEPDPATGAGELQRRAGPGAHGGLPRGRARHPARAHLRLPELPPVPGHAGDPSSRGHEPTSGGADLCAHQRPGGASGRSEPAPGLHGAPGDLHHHRQRSELELNGGPTLRRLEWLARCRSILRLIPAGGDCPPHDHG
ncbi:unnamed protein product, partial [Effrenium voratum]